MFTDQLLGLSHSLLRKLFALAMKKCTTPVVQKRLGHSLGVAVGGSKARDAGIG